MSKVNVQLLREVQHALNVCVYENELGYNHGEWIKELRVRVNAALAEATDGTILWKVVSAFGDEEATCGQWNLNVFPIDKEFCWMVKESDGTVVLSGHKGDREQAKEAAIKAAKGL